VVNGDNTFNITSGGESPARAALALVFNSSDDTFGGPVERARGVGVGASDEIAESGNAAVIATELGLVSKVDRLEFPTGEVSELVELDGVAAVARVMSLNEVHVCLEDTEAVEELLRGVRLLECHHPLGESILVLLLSEGRSQAEAQKHCKHRLHRRVLL